MKKIKNPLLFIRDVFLCIVVTLIIMAAVVGIPFAVAEFN